MATTMKVRDKMWQEMGRLNRLITSNTKEATPVDVFYIEKQLSAVFDDPDLNNLLEANFHAAMATSHGMYDMDKFVKVWSGLKAIHQKYTDGSALEDIKVCQQMLNDYDAVYEICAEENTVTKLDKFISADLKLTTSIMNEELATRS